MSNVNDPATNATPLAGGGAKSALKVAIPIVVLMAVIFGVTFFAQYTPKTDEKDDPAVKGSSEPPLRFFTSARRWNPDPFASLQDRLFPGFYEVQANAAGTPNSASFWCENRNDKSVTMQVRHVSCSSCSGARVAPIPADAARQILEMTAASALPHGLFAPIPLGMAGPAANLAEDRLKWQSATFRDNPNPEYNIPAGNPGSPWAPQWAIVELRFSVGALGTKDLLTGFSLQVDGTKQTGTAECRIFFEGVSPFDLSRTDVDVGELSETSEPRTVEFLAYSSTRGPNGNGPGDLAVPRVLVQLPTGGVGEPGPFVSASPPVRVSEEELAAVAAEVGAKRPIRVEAAYRISLTISPKVGDQVIDLGPLERDVFVSTADTQRVIRVRGRVRGGIWLDDNARDVSLNYPHPRGVIGHKQRIVTDQPGAEVVLVKDPATPDFLELKLVKLPPASDRGYYELQVGVPGGKGPDGSWRGFVVLEVKAAKPQRIRIPVRGTATSG